MYEQIDLDAIESNRDEAPDYKSKLKADSLGAPTRVDERVYRVRMISSLEAEEKSRYDEFAKVAEKEGLKNIAGIFRDILREEMRHSGQLPQSQTMSNLRTSIGREKEKIAILKTMLSGAKNDGDFALAERLTRMISEEEGHVRRLSDAVKRLEDSMKMAGPKATADEVKFCEFGTCSQMSARVEEKVCEFGTCVPKSKNAGGRSPIEKD